MRQALTSATARFALASLTLAIIGTPPFTAAGAAATTTATTQAAAPIVVPLHPGLVITVVTRAGLVGSAGSLDVADTETLYSVVADAADRVLFKFTIAAPADQKAADLLKKPLSLTRAVRREDLGSSNRVNLSWSTDDPEMLAGQTFIQTSAAVLRALKDKGETAFVMGINEGGLFGGVPLLAGGEKDGAPGNLSGLLQAMGVERHYYRGTLRRVEAGMVPFSVLLNGERSTLPAIHARGTLKFTDHERAVDFHFLDDADNALTLKWVVGQNYAMITRIDTAPVRSASQHQGRPGSIDLGSSPEAQRLAGKTCRAELHGIYFATGSAQLLEESDPALATVSALLIAHPDWKVTVEGHTDNIGSAGYNRDLSNRRAVAVRDALISRQVPAGNLAAKGFGFDKPRESNDTVEGRARNRRVEIARACSP